MAPEGYLGINDYKIGQPPNWRDGRFWTNTFWRGRVFNRLRYTRAVENYIIQMHQRHWETICQYDEATKERGEQSILMEEKLLPVLSVITEWADRYRLTPNEYNAKYGQVDDAANSLGGDDEG